MIESSRLLPTGSPTTPSRCRVGEALPLGGFAAGAPVVSRTMSPKTHATATGASNMDGGGSSESGDWKPAQVEMRRAPDGVAYTRQEFLDLFGGLDEWHAVHVLVETRSLVGSANVLRPSKHGQAYQCPECSVLFNCATHKWGIRRTQSAVPHVASQRTRRRREEWVIRKRGESPRGVSFD